MNRRRFVSFSAASVAATSASLNAATGIFAPAPAPDKGKSTGLSRPLKQGDIILFQGDSITDAHRSRKTEGEANNGTAMGRGYAAVIAGGLLVDHRNLHLQIYNRGTSGNKVPDLDRRWEKDAIDLKPAVLSILIGVNDIWHSLKGRYDGTPENYRDGLTALIMRTKAALPDVQLVICEPFVLKCGAVDKQWFPEFDERKAFAKEVTKRAGALWVPFQEVFDDAVAAGTDPGFWAQDGIHPTAAGHALMARRWRETVGI